MDPKNLKAFLMKHSLTESEFSRLLGVTPMAVNHWLTGRRSVSLTVARLIKLFDIEPELMKVFAA